MVAEFGRSRRSISGGHNVAGLVLPLAAHNERRRKEVWTSEIVSSVALSGSLGCGQIIRRSLVTAVGLLSLLPEGSFGHQLAHVSVGRLSAAYTYVFPERGR